MSKLTALTAIAIIDTLAAAALHALDSHVAVVATLLVTGIFLQITIAGMVASDRRNG